MLTVLLDLGSSGSYWYMNDPAVSPVGRGVNILSAYVRWIEGAINFVRLDYSRDLGLSHIVYSSCNVSVSFV